MTRDLFFWTSLGGFAVSEAAIVMMDPIGKRFIRYALICNLILWAVLVYLLVLVVR